MNIMNNSSENNQNYDNDYSYDKDDEYDEEDEEDDEDDEDEDEDEDDEDDEDEDDEDDEDEDDEDENVRINFTLPKKMKNNWKNLAKDMSVSISQLIRNAVQNYNQAIEKNLDSDIKSMEMDFDKLGNDLEDMGDKIGPLIEKKVTDILKPLGILPEDEENKKRDIEDIDVSSTKSEQRSNFSGNQKTILQKSGDPFESLKKLKELFDTGIITQEEFEEKKKKLLDKI